MLGSIITDQIDQNIEKALPIIKAHHYDYVEIHNVFGKSIEELNMEEVIKLKRLLNAYDLKVSCISSTIFFLCPLYESDRVTLFNDHFYSIKGHVEDHLKYLENCKMICKLLDCSLVRIFPFRFPENRGAPFGTRSDQIEIEKNIRRAIDVVKDTNITLALENCPYSHLPKASMTYEIVKRINHPQLKMLYDPANAFRAFPENVANAYTEDHIDIFKDKIVHMHLKDYYYDSSCSKPFVHVPLFDGEVGIREILEQFNDYQGFVSLEPEVDFDGALLCLDRLNKVLGKI